MTLALNCAGNGFAQTSQSTQLSSVNLTLVSVARVVWGNPLDGQSVVPRTKNFLQAGSVSLFPFDLFLVEIATAVLDVLCVFQLS